MAEDSSRTKMLEKEMGDGLLKKGLVGISRLADKAGFTQEEKYAGKTKEEMAKKPGSETKPKGYKKGGAVKRDGCATKGKTKGRMV